MTTDPQKLTIVTTDPQNLTIKFIAVNDRLLAVDAAVTLPAPGAVVDPVTVTLD